MRNHFVPLLFCFLLFARIASAQIADCDCSPYQQAFEAQLRAAEEVRYGALTSNNFEVLRPVLGSDLIYIHSTGVAQSKVDFLKALESGALRYRKITTQPTAVRFYGDIGVLNGRGTFEVTTKQGDVARDLTANLIYTAVYALRGEGLARHWELVSWQSGAASKD